MKSLYKDKIGNHVVEPQNFLMVRAKRLPLIKDTIKNANTIFEKIDENDNSELMYINRYIDPFDKEFFQVVIAKKDKTNPYIAKTAFPIFKYNNILRRIYTYEPKKKGLTVTVSPLGLMI